MGRRTGISRQLRKGIEMTEYEFSDSPLPSEQNTPEIRAQIEALAKPEIVFEHGHWWVKFCDLTFDVTDTDRGFELEQM